MIDIKLSPPREGARGGREQFKWDDLKSHDLKDREHYLGHSVKVGLLERKNKFYKHDWYLKKDTESGEKDIDEAKLTRLYEDEIMQEMLGVKPKRLMLLKSKPSDPKQLKELLNLGDNNSNSKSEHESKSNFGPKSYRKSYSRSVSRSLTRSRSKSPSNSRHKRSHRNRTSDSHKSKHRSSYKDRHSSRHKHKSGHSSRYSRSRSRSSSQSRYSKHRKSKYDR